jgi:integrase
MIEYVFRPTRRIGKRRIVSRLYRGRYSLSRGGKPVTVALSTADKSVAQKRLRDIVVMKQKESEGLISPAAQRQAAVQPLTLLVTEYRDDLRGRDLAPAHIKETIARTLRVASTSAWKVLGDIRPASFMQFRSHLKCGAKTKKEYQTSVNAFLNWCVKTEKLTSNPLAKVDRVDIRGKAVRPTRAFTVDELRQLFEISVHSLFYRTLLYTGQRRTETASLVWGDLDFKTLTALFRDGNMKDKEKRAVPLHRDLALALKIAKPFAAMPTDAVFPTAPSYEVLIADLERAGIERKDPLNRVVHFHSFRKTFQTMGVRAGINQRSAQALLGHSDPALTANVYTDVAALHLHDEVAKLPWISGVHIDAQNVCVSVPNRKMPEILRRLIEEAKALMQAEFPDETLSSKVAARHGFEP